MIDNNAIFNGQTRYLDVVTPPVLRSWGSEYLQTLLNNNKIFNDFLYKIKHNSRLFLLILAVEFLYFQNTLR